MQQQKPNRLKVNRDRMLEAIAGSTAIAKGHPTRNKGSSRSR